MGKTNSRIKEVKPYLSKNKMPDKQVTTIKSPQVDKENKQPNIIINNDNKKDENNLEYMCLKANKSDDKEYLVYREEQNKLKNNNIKILDNKNILINKNIPNDKLIIMKETSFHERLVSKGSKDFTTIGGSLQEDIRKYYKFKELIGGGSFGSVRVGFKKDNPQKLFAIKSVAKTKLSSEDLENLMKEVEILSSLDHPNIVKFIETYNDTYYFHIVMELCQGKEVIERIIDEGQISESRVANIIYKVTSAINYCHKIGITHRDIKPENILFESQDPDAEIKLIDFGLSKKHIPSEKMHTILGTPYYVAPEVLKGNYDEKCDVWSIGAITYTMISGMPPFTGFTNSQIFDRILNAEVRFDKNRWKNISLYCIDFIKKCLIKNPTERMSAEKALAHEWLSNLDSDIHSFLKIDNKILINLKNYTKPNRFKKLVLKYLVNRITQQDLKKLREAFIVIDYNNTGFIEYHELENAFKKADLSYSTEELHKIFKEGEYHGKIEYSDFLGACLDQKSFITKENIISAFTYFDVDCNGYVDSKDLKNVLLKLGKNILNQEELDKMILEINNNKDIITLNDFLNLFGLEEE